ncbi:response regulator transcription factor [Paenibacillus sp. PL2-23]|uniref:response regulator transcription factor n=1 Tax=Paenibacillus sp. PL2-23 TaxID=2100729 RepID=UPI0030F5B042
MKRILLIEDETNFAKFIEMELAHEGFSVTVAGDGKSGLMFALSGHWDLILLDLMLPGMDGFEVCREIRKAKQTPMIMITARDSVSDRVSGLDGGADDYLPKPFAIEELLARIRVIFRRLQDKQEPSAVLESDGLVMELESRIVTRHHERIELTKREFALLETFLKNVNRVLSRETLLNTVWGYEAIVDANVVDVYVRYLRHKIDDPDKPSRIEAVRGIGYVMRR